ncbi:hypothetical protein [uncultured Amaricoccus sp.]|uniref:hypothetical protein n=1 Tax=uncultured Amaricoccus sp. TaxID=339341 RepID=UPI00260DD78F|nr:hypothetical protein [uncultured Amaricoccus sp.]
MSCRPSPLQNRVAPDGSLNAVAARGTLMGNRGGRLHRADGTLGRARWRSRAWIACLTEFRGRHRAVWGESYSEIFFLDEATALAAGHRPCFECRRAEALAFAAAWGEPAPRAGEMDAVLHAERLGPRQRIAFGALPEGAIFAAAEGFHLRTERGALLWSFAGYRPARRFAAEEIVQAVTPAHVRAALAQGYRPRLHPSAAAQLSAR